MEENFEQLPGNKQNNKKALASFILALVGLIIAGIPCGIAAIVTGSMALSKFNPDTEKNKWMAIVGIVLGAIDIILTIAVLPSIYRTMGIL